MADIFNNPAFRTSWSRPGGDPYAQDLLRQFAANDAKLAAQRKAAQDKEDTWEAEQRAQDQKVLGQASGRLSELRGDPIDQMLLDQLTGRVTGGDVPYSDSVINAMFAQRSDQAAAGQQAAVDRLLKAGMNPGDPGFAAALAELESDRQKSMQSLRSQIDSVANLANYDARGQSMGQLAGVNNARNAAITNQNNYLTDLLATQSVSRQRPDAAPQATGWVINSGGQKPAPAPAPAPSPTPVPRPAPQRSGLAVAPNQPGRTYNVGTGSLGRTSGSVATNGGTWNGATPQKQTWTASGSAGTVTGQNPQPPQAPTFAPVTVPAKKVGKYTMTPY